MNLKELERILFKSSSDLMRKQGKKVFNQGLVTKIKGKRINNIYSIYGRVSNSKRTEEFNTYIKIDLANKKMQEVNCTCDNFRELSNKGYSFMCSHITATIHKFFSEISRKKVKKPKINKYKNRVEKNEIMSKSNSQNKSKINQDNIEKNRTVRLVRKIGKDSVYYEGQDGIANKKIKINPNELRSFLECVSDKKIKFRYEYIEFKTSVLQKDLPLTFTLKEKNEHFVLTTHKQFPISLNANNDVYLFKWQIYLPTKDQIEKYIPLCEKLKRQGQIVYTKNIKNYNKIISVLSSISNDINIGESVKIFASNFLKPEFYIYKEKDNIYCDIKINYASEKVNIINDGKSKENIVRNYKKEEKILMEIEKCNFIKRNDRFVFIGGDEELFDILSSKGQNIHSLGRVTFGKGLENMKIYNSSSIDAELYENDGYYDFSYNIKGIESSELNSIFTAYKSKDRFYKTKDNGFIDFEDDGVKSFFDLIEILDIKDGMGQIEKSKALYLNENIKNNKMEFMKGKEKLKEIQNNLSNMKNENIIIPKNLKAKLRQYQVEGFRWLKNLSSLGFGGILADEMGLGKTIQTITFILSEDNKKTIIITPTSLIYNWKSELEKFAPNLKVGIVHGKKEKRIKQIENLNEYDIILTTYGTLRMDIKKYENIIFDYCVIDEGQNIKNPLTENTKTIKEIKARVRFALTGTPIENNLTELWSIFDFVMPGYLYSKEKFSEKFINTSEDNLENLKLLIKPFILRRTKKEVMRELPDKIEKKVLIQMTPAQKSIYKSYIKTIREKMNKNVDGKIEIFSYLTRLRQICLDPSLVMDEYSGGSGKLKVAMELIKDHVDSNGKVLLFSQFTSALHNIGEKLEEKGIKYFTLDGTTRPKKRIEMVNEFNDSQETKVFLISLKAGGTGLNLTSANLVIHFDPWWNPAVENQATDRAHRIGQRNVVDVIKLIAKGTIEEKIILLQEDKKQLTYNIITGDLKNSNLISKLSKEELVQLFTR